MTADHRALPSPWDIGAHAMEVVRTWVMPLLHDDPRAATAHCYWVAVTPPDQGDAVLYGAPARERHNHDWHWQTAPDGWSWTEDRRAWVRDMRRFGGDAWLLFRTETPEGMLVRVIVLHPQARPRWYDLFANEDL